MARKPPFGLVATCGLLAIAAMVVAVYLGGTGRTVLAMMGTVLFVSLGGLTFELARRRSL
jgi:hypothetical protein